MTGSVFSLTASMKFLTDRPRGSIDPDLRGPVLKADLVIPNIDPSAHDLSVKSELKIPGLCFLTCQCQGDITVPFLEAIRKGDAHLSLVRRFKPQVPDLALAQ